jgi:DNA-binding XRE family transcriptional regulator
MSRGIFSPEELAELEAFDREIEDEDEPLTLEEWRASMRRDRGLEGPPKERSPEEREHDRIKSREHRAANAEYYRAAHRAWYAKNREYAQAWQREYCRTHAEAHAAAQLRLRERNRDSEARFRLRELRKALGLTQAELGRLFDRRRQVVCNWESGVSNIPARVLEWMEMYSTGKIEEWGNRA